MTKQSEELAILTEYADACKDLYNSLKDQQFSIVKSRYDLSERQIQLMTEMEDSVIDSLTYQNLMSDYQSALEIDMATLQNARKKTHREDMSTLDFTKYMIRDVKKEMDVVLDSKVRMDNVDDDIRKVKSDYIEFVHSDQFYERRKQHLEELKEASEKETDESLRKELQKKLHFIENLDSCRFLVERLESNGEKEIDRLKKQFFSNNLGEFTMKKFSSACKRFKLDPAIHRHFLNLEEMFLPEQYHPFNNIFLFVGISFISFADSQRKDEVAYVNKLVNNLVFLIQHKFPSETEKDRFVQLIQEIDDYFLPFEEEFKEKNITWKNHPRRLQAGERAERRKRDVILQKLKLRGIEADPSLDSIALQNMLSEASAASIDERKKRLQEEEQQAEKTEEESSDEKEEDAQPEEQTTGRGLTRPIIYHLTETDDDTEEVCDASDVLSGLDVEVLNSDSTSDPIDLNNATIVKLTSTNGLTPKTLPTILPE